LSITMLWAKRIALLSLLFLGTLSAFSADKLIALTFDDGPRPYVLLGTKTPQAAPGLIQVLDENNVKATFFVVGWRLTPKTWGDRRYETNIGVSCIEAAQQLLKHGHELEDHTYSHEELRTAQRKKGEQWVVSDVDHSAEVIQAVSGVRPKYVRPPDWILPEDARHDIERHGYTVLTISSENPIALRDVNSLDYLCAGAHPVNCPKPSLADSVIRQIEQREKKNVYTHILAFHELSSTTAMLPQLMQNLKTRGYRFVTLDEYMRIVAPSTQQIAMKISR
jgi:peptidoglycan/xylan/chitin deacetylase (PgdA/CDA1 family)